ncbi:MAG: twin-arginine translocase subunit TatC [Vicinamibacterales bacterium]
MASLAAIPLPPEDSNDSGRMSFLEHLEEFRKRLIRCCLAVVIGAATSFTYIDAIVAFVLTPMREALPSGTTLVYTRPAEAFSLYLNVALITGALLAAPFVMFQLWRFVAPGLYANEKRLVVPFVLLTTIGALSGAAFSHWVVFPYMLAFFGTFSSPDLLFIPRLEDAFSLYVRMLVGLVIVFQMPSIIFFLARVRVVTAGFLWRHLRHAVLGSVVLAAVLTPSPDPWNQILFAAPMLGLYLLSIAIAWMVAPREGAPVSAKSPSVTAIVIAASVFEQARSKKTARTQPFSKLEKR